MSWMSGTDLMDSVISIAKKHVASDQERADFYEALIPIWEERGCDDLIALNGSDLAFDVALHRCHPEWWEGDEPTFVGDPPRLNNDMEN